MAWTGARRPARYLAIERMPLRYLPAIAGRRTCVSALLLLPTPTAVGNQTAPSIAEWRTCRNCELLTGPGRYLSPAFTSYLMGLPSGAARRALGNAVVPACAEAIGRFVIGEIIKPCTVNAMAG